MSNFQSSDLKCSVTQKIERALKLWFLNNLDLTLKKEKEKKMYLGNSNAILVFKRRKIG